MSDPITAIVDHAERLLAEGRSKEAVSILVAQTRLHQDCFNLWYCLGRAHFLGGEHFEAERAFRAALELRGDVPDAHYNLAVSLIYQDKLSESIEYFLGARRLNPRNPEVRQALLKTLFTLLQRDGAAEAFRGRKLAPLIEHPLASVIVPTQNRLPLLGDALSSVHRQSHPDWEVIVANDGGESISPLLESLPRDLRQRVRAIDLPTTRGPAAARNQAIKLAKGDVVTFLDDDDRYLPDHLRCLISGLRGANAAMAYTATELVRESVHGGVREELGRQRFQPGFRYSRPLLLVGNFIPINAWGVRRECFDAVGMFDESLHFLEDWDFLLRVSDQFDIHQIDAVTAEYRVTERANDSVSKRHSHREGVEAIHRRHPARGLERVLLARKIYLETLA